MLTTRSALTEELSDLELAELRTLVFTAFDGGFSDPDWDHAQGGRHFLGVIDGTPVAHASVVPRRLQIGERNLHTGYVEGVAVAPAHRRKGYAESLMAELDEFLIATFELGALSATEMSLPLYERLGWQVWLGPTAVIVDGKPQRTPEDDGGVMILETPTTGALDPKAVLACDWREGDVW